MKTHFQGIDIIFNENINQIEDFMAKIPDNKQQQREKKVLEMATSQIANQPIVQLLLQQQASIGLVKLT